MRAGGVEPLPPHPPEAVGPGRFGVVGGLGGGGAVLRQPPAGLWGGLGPPLLACPRKTSPRPAGGRWVPGCTLSRAHRVSAQVLKVGERESSGPLRNKWRLGVHGWICSEGGLPGLYTVIGLGLATGEKKKKKYQYLLKDSAVALPF